MEDAHVMTLQLQQAPQVCVFGIFDGHGGSLVAEAIREDLLTEVLAACGDIDFTHPSAIQQGLCTGFLAADRKLRERPDIQDQADEIGSTGLMVVVTPTHVIVANCGDTRCILSTNDRVLALSLDHKPSDEKEKERIINAGGSVFRNRVCGGVAVSRSFGDFWFKRNDTLKDFQQQVSAEPHLHVRERFVSDEFLLLACDGIYDVLSNEQVQQFVRQKLAAGFKDTGLICEQLMDECLARGSRDNMSVILVLFEGAKLLGKKKCIIQ